MAEKDHMMNRLASHIMTAEPHRLGKITAMTISTAPMLDISSMKTISLFSNQRFTTVAPVLVAIHSDGP